MSATLERVRAITGARWASTGEMKDALRDALASQPEAPDPHTCDWFGRFTCRVCGKHRDQPEAPKGQGAERLPVREHARRRGSLDGADAQALEGALSQVERDLDAANARAEKAEAMSVQARMLLKEDGEMQALLDAANARADAAEKHLEQHRQEDPHELQAVRRQLADTESHCRALAEDVTREKARADAAERLVTEWKKLHGEATKLWREAGDKADQLAARVTELEALTPKPYTFQIRFDGPPGPESGRFVECETLDGKGVSVGHWEQDGDDWLLIVEGYDPPNQCTPEERTVLEACKAMELGDDDPDADPLEPQEVGENCYIYTDDQCAIARAELANRAAKALGAERS